MVLCKMFQQEEGQKTQEKETQTALRLCKKHIFWTFLDLKPSLNTCGTAVKLKKKLWLIPTSGDFLMMSAMMHCELVRKKGFNQHISSLSSHVGSVVSPFHL